MPAAIMMPRKIPPGVDISTPTALMDMFPTLLELIGAPLPRNRVVDGRSLWPLLKGDTDRSPHKILFHYCGEQMFAARLIPKSGELFLSFGLLYFSDFGLVIYFGVLLN